MYHPLFRSNAPPGPVRVRGRARAGSGDARPPAGGCRPEPFVRSRIRRVCFGAASVAAAAGTALLVAALAAWSNLDLLRDAFAEQFRLAADLARARLGGE